MLPSDTLGVLTGIFWTFIPSASPNNAPYMIFGVDTDNSGTWDGGVNDSLVIAFDTFDPIVKDVWYETGLRDSTTVHVVGGRPGLTPGTYSSSGTQDTLANLRNMTTTGAEKWGDLNVLRAYVEVGQWPGVSSYTAYVDDMALSTAVPEVRGWLMVGVAGAVALVLRRRLGFANW